MNFIKHPCPWCGRGIFRPRCEYEKDFLFFQKQVFFCPHCNGGIKFIRHALSILICSIFTLTVNFFFIFLVLLCNINRFISGCIIMVFCVLSAVIMIWFLFQIGALAYIKDERNSPQGNLER
jgi:hypothetical protein